MSSEHGEIATPQRYLFDEVFALDGQRAPREAGVDRRDMERAVETARQDGYERGYADGRKAAADDRAERLAAASEKLVRQADAMAEDAATGREQICEDAVQLAITAARKLAPALMARAPVAEIEVLLRDCLGELREAPHLVVRVAEDLAEDMRERCDPITRETGFTGRLVVMGDPGIAPGDGRIDWADGGIVRSRETIEAAIDAALQRYLGGAEETQGDKEDENG